jgi:hypothetical protein
MLTFIAHGNILSLNWYINFFKKIFWNIGQVTRIATIVVSTKLGFRTACSLLILMAVHPKVQRRGGILQYDFNPKFHEYPAVCSEIIRGRTQIRVCHSVFTYNTEVSQPLIPYTTSTTSTTASTVALATGPTGELFFHLWKALIFYRQLGQEKYMLCHLLVGIYSTTSTLIYSLYHGGWIVALLVHRRMLPIYTYNSKEWHT